MSKALLLAIGGLNFFANTKPTVTFLKGKDKASGELIKVQADYSGWDKDKGIDLKAIKEKAKSGKDYIRVSITLTEDNKASYYNGFLMPNPRKTDENRKPDLTGTIDLTRGANGPQLQLAAWYHPAKDGKQEYYSLSITDANKADSTTPPVESKSEPLASDVDNAADVPAEIDPPF